MPDNVCSRAVPHDNRAGTRVQNGPPGDDPPPIGGVSPRPLSVGGSGGPGIAGGQSSPRVVSVGSLLDSIREDLYSGKRPVQYAVANEPWGSIALRPGDVIGIAGPPGKGKTALSMQLVVDALRLHEGVNALVVNVEMSPERLFERQVSRLSGVAFADIADRMILGPQVEQIERALSTLEMLKERLFFMREPFNIETIARSLIEIKPHILLVDYVQRIEYGNGTLDARARLNAVMSETRRIASAGIAVMIVSAVGRTNSKRDGGYSSRELGLGSFRESSELEYGVDDAFIFTDAGSGSAKASGGPRVMKLRHVKSRNHLQKDVTLEFDGAVQQFRLLGDHKEHKKPAKEQRKPPAASGSNPPVNDRWAQDFLGDGLL